MTEFDRAGTEELLRHFYTLTGIKICVFDREFREIAFYPLQWIPFCQYVHSAPKGAALCGESGRWALETCRRTGRRVMFTCRMGLTECAAPIICDGGTLGYVMLGEIRGAEASPRVPEETALACGLDPEELQRLYDGLEPVERAVVQSAAEILEACASYIYLKGLLRESAGDLQKRMDRYLSQHLAEDLGTGELCRAFGYSRTAMYRMFRDFYGETILEHVTRLRVARAKTLLREGEEKVFRVAALVGFSDYNYFIKVFKRATGLSPLQYRKQYAAGGRTGEETEKTAVR